MTVDRSKLVEAAGMDAFTTIKDTVPVNEAVRFYGYEPNRAGFIRCPFHSDKTPSLKLYDRKFYCFGCGAHGSVIDFVALLFNINPLDAVKRLAADFKVDLNLDHPPDRPDLERQRQAQSLFTEWREKTLNEIDKSIRAANLADFVNLTETAAFALRYREILEHWADELLHGTMEAQMAVFRGRKGVTRICKAILHHTPTRSSAA